MELTGGVLAQPHQALNGSPAPQELSIVVCACIPALRREKQEGQSPRSSSDS